MLGSAVIRTPLRVLQEAGEAFLFLRLLLALLLQLALARRRVRRGLSLEVRLQDWRRPDGGHGLWEDEEPHREVGERALAGVGGVGGDGVRTVGR